MAKYFKSQGLNAVDADMVYRLGEYYGENGRADFSKDNAEEFLDNHEFLWDEKILRDTLNQSEDVILFGFAGNMFEMLHYFDKLIYLDLPLDKIHERMSHPERDNPLDFGTQEYERNVTIEHVKNSLRPDAKRHGFIFIDAMKTPEDIFSEVSAMIKPR